jgi:hypothetical protein
MSRYIDADNIANRIRSRIGYFGLYHPEDTKNIEELQTCLELVKGTPTAEVRPIVYGEWIDINGIKSCNQCVAGNASAYDSFCPNCGAFMKKESEEGIISETSMHHLICAFCDNDKCVRGTKECEFEQWKEKEKEK